MMKTEVLNGALNTCGSCCEERLAHYTIGWAIGYRVSYIIVAINSVISAARGTLTKDTDMDFIAEKADLEALSFGYQDSCLSDASLTALMEGVFATGASALNAAALILRQACKCREFFLSEMLTTSIKGSSNSYRDAIVETFIVFINQNKCQ